MNRCRTAAAAAVALIVLTAGGCQSVQNLANLYQMSFFVTSKGSGKGADYGGLSGADAHCEALAIAAGSDKRSWRAYLSTNAAGAVPTQHARERIGRGPWRNAKGVVIAHSVDDLHGANKLTKETALTEKGEMVNGSGDSPNMHDILTGSQSDGRAIGGTADRTCGNWTLSGSTGSAMVGHHDRRGLSDDAASKSWNSSHPTKGCSEEALRSTGGAGLIYCFSTY